MGVIPKLWRRPRSSSLPLHPSRSSKLRIPRIGSKRLLRLLSILFLLAIVPPVFFHFRLRRFHQMRARRCRWLENPPLVCAHGGDSSRAPPNTMAAYQVALDSHVDCIEIDVSRSLDGVLLALHDRDLQRMSGNETAKVGYWRMEEIKKLNAGFQSGHDSPNQEVPTVEDALKLVSSSVRQVILDVKVGPPLYEKGLAKDIFSLAQKTRCRNCLVWSKSDMIARDVIKLSPNATVGYIVMKDPLTGASSNLLRMKNASVVGVYHPLIDDKLMKILHGAKKVYAWTVEDAEAMQDMLLKHVDAIVTGRPPLIQSLMREMKVECLEEGFLLP